jgi:hypothetical protein
MKAELFTKVDRPGALLAQQEALEQEIKALKGEMIDAGEGKHDGALFRANVILANRNSVDWKAVAAECNIPEEIISKNTKVAAVISVRVTSK